MLFCEKLFKGLEGFSLIEDYKCMRSSFRVGRGALTPTLANNNHFDTNNQMSG